MNLPPRTEEINDLFQDFQDELLIRSKKLKFPVTFNDITEDILLLLDQPTNIDLSPKKKGTI